MSSRAPQSQRLYPLDMKEPYVDCQSVALANVIEPHARDEGQYAGMRAIVECNGMGEPEVVEIVVHIASQATERDVTQAYGQCKPRAIQAAREAMLRSCAVCPVAIMNQ